MQQDESYRKTAFYVNNFAHFEMHEMVRRETLVSTGKIKGSGRVPEGDGIAASAGCTLSKVSRTNPSLSLELAGKGGPENFKGRRRAYAPRRIPDRFPVTAGIRSEMATRPLD